MRSTSLWFLVASLYAANVLVQTSKYGGQTLMHGWVGSKCLSRIVENSPSFWCRRSLSRHGPSSSTAMHDTWRSKDQPWRVDPTSAEVRVCFWLLFRWKQSLSSSLFSIVGIFCYVSNHCPALLKIRTVSKLFRLFVRCAAWRERPCTLCTNSRA